MKKLIHLIISGLVLCSACNKDNTELNPLSGKLKRALYYDSLNVLRETTDYVYDASDNLYMLKSNLKNMQLYKNGDTLTLITKSLDTTTLDSITHTEYAYLNSSGFIGKIEYSDNTNIRRFEREYQTNPAGILQNVLFEPSGNSSKLFDFVYSNGNYIRYKLDYSFTMPFPPFTEMKDTVIFNYTYANLSADLFFAPTATNAFDNAFNYFGYKNALPNNQLMERFYIEGQTDTTHIAYIIKNNQLTEYINYINNRFAGKSIFEYY